VGCTVGAPTIAGSVALQVHGATTAVAGAKNLGKVLSELYSVVFASSSTSGAGNNLGNLGTPPSSSSGGSGAGLRYQMKPQDLDWRGSSKTFQDALDEAFKRTGIPRDQFAPSAWSKDVYKKSVPVQYDGPNGAQVSIDYPHYGVDKTGTWASGPDAPHIGWEVGKRASRTKGHIILDSVPARR
jgi:hypothetical protein